MCTVLDEAINTGIEKGLQKGLQKGLEGGELIKGYRLANRYMERLQKSFAEALEFAELTEEEYFQGKELLEKYL